MKAKIIKIISNQYTVWTEDGQRVLCVAMGKLRKNVSPVVGDNVIIQKYDNQTGIEKIEPRQNSMIRPLIANVDQAIIVMSAKDPDFSRTLVNRLSFLIEDANIHPILCVTKMDLAKEDKEIQDIIKEYEMSGMEVILCDKNNINEQLQRILKDKITVLTGQSGVGKSTLLNTLNPHFSLQTQEISKALGRGKHTTRHCELHEVAGGLVADTPGFSSLDFSHMTEEDLANSVAEFRPYLGNCKFRNCIHQNEPGCSIKEAVEEGKIARSRYEDYLEVLKIIQGRKEKY